MIPVQAYEKFTGKQFSESMLAKRLRRKATRTNKQVGHLKTCAAQCQAKGNATATNTANANFAKLAKLSPHDISRAM